MSNDKTIVLTEQFVKDFLEGNCSGHDWWHIERVRKMTKKIAVEEGANLFICEMAALLHDVADEKLNVTEDIGINRVKEWLNYVSLDEDCIERIMGIIENMSYKGGGVPLMKTLEGKIVQDADRLDAIGAIGIARTFAYSGAKGQLIYDPSIHVRENMTKEEYRKNKTTAINHFYEKLLKLEGLMNTQSGKRLAKKRQTIMVDFLENFFEEWNGQ